jgi:mannose-6-phosphate isomerase-like protein (cupin superfamily)
MVVKLVLFYDVLVISYDDFECQVGATNRGGMGNASSIVFPLALAPSAVMPGKGFARTVLSPETCGAKNFSLSVNILSAGTDTGDIVHSAEQGWFVLSGRGVVVMEGVRHPIKPGDAIFAPASGGTHRFEVAPEGDLTYVLVFSPPPVRDFAKR